MTIQPAELVAIPFPYSDISTHKKRPVLVLTKPDERGDFIGLAVTSVPTEANAFCIQPDAMEHGKLPKNSWVRYDKVFTLDSALVNKKYGSLQNNVFRKITNHLCHYFGCYE